VLTKSSTGIVWAAPSGSTYPEDIITIVECEVDSQGNVTSTADFDDTLLDL